MGWCGSASKISLDHSLRVPVVPEHLSQVFDLLTLSVAITHLLGSVLWTPDDVSLNSGQVVRVNVEVSVRVSSCGRPGCESLCPSFLVVH